MKTVSIGYSYPTSPNAKTYGFYNGGCYVVELDDNNGKHTIGGYSSFEEAKKVADETSLPYHKYSIVKA